MTTKTELIWQKGRNGENRPALSRNMRVKGGAVLQDGVALAALLGAVDLKRLQIQ